MYIYVCAVFLPVKPSCISYLWYFLAQLWPQPQPRGRLVQLRMRCADGRDARWDVRMVGAYLMGIQWLESFYIDPTILLLDCSHFSLDPRFCLMARVINLIRKSSLWIGGNPPVHSQGLWIRLWSSTLWWILTTSQSKWVTPISQ